MNDFIELGSKPAEITEAPSPRKEPAVYYPSLHISGPEDMDFPDEGTATIRFKKGDSGTRKRGDKKEYYCDLEVIAIKPMLGSRMMDAPKGPKFGESLDRALAKREETSDED